MNDINLRDPNIDPYNQARQLRTQVQELQDQVMQLTNARDDLLRIGTLMYQELQEFVDDGHQVGPNSTDTTALLADWWELLQKYGTGWVQMIAELDDDLSVIDSLPRFGSKTCDYSGPPPFPNDTMCQWCAATGHPYGDESYGMCKCP